MNKWVWSTSATDRENRNALRTKHVTVTFIPQQILHKMLWDRN